MIGCSSSSDPIDPLGWRWTISESTMFDGSEERFVIDPTTTGDDAYISLTFTSNADEDYDIFLNEIVLEFEGDGNGPDFGTMRLEGSDDLLSANGGELTEDIYFFPKAAYLAAIGGDATGFFASYRVTITAHFSFSQGSGDNDVTLTDSIVFTVAPVEEEEEEEG
jgi:hypothetical protein